MLLCPDLTIDQMMGEQYIDASVDIVSPCFVMR